MRRTTAATWYTNGSSKYTSSDEMRYRKLRTEMMSYTFSTPGRSNLPLTSFDRKSMGTPRILRSSSYAFTSFLNLFSHPCMWSA